MWSRQKGPLRVYKLSNCWKVSVRRRVQQNSQGIKYTIEHNGDSHQRVEIIWHNSDFIKNWTPLKKWWRDNKKTGQGGCQETCRDIKGAAGSSGKIWLCTACDNNLRILHMSVLCGRVATQKPFLAEEKYPSLASFPEQNTSGLPKSMWENDKTGLFCRNSKSCYAHHQKSTIATLKHGSSSIMLQLECHLSSQQWPVAYIQINKRVTSAGED